MKQQDINLWKKYTSATCNKWLENNTGITLQDENGEIRKPQWILDEYKVKLGKCVLSTYSVVEHYTGNLFCYL